MDEGITFPRKGGLQMTVYSFQANLSDGTTVSLEAYRGKVLIIVNTASQCGLTPQYEGLQGLYEKYKDQGLVVLGFPCNQFGEQEPGTNEEIRQFCTTQYRVTFPMFQKIDVNGENAHPLFQYLREQAPEDADLDRNGRLYQHLMQKQPQLLEGSNIRWNFTKFLIDREGRLVKRVAPSTPPEAMEEDIQKLLG